MGVRAITNFAGVERQPAFSPDGRSVAFVSNHEGQHDIYVGLLSGGRLVRVTNDPNVEARPRWSSDGSKLLYAWLNESGLWDAWVIPALGGVARKLVNNAVDPVWSPNGRSVVYADLATGGISMYDLGSRQSHVVTRPELLARHRQPSFSPDGRRLAFVRRVNGPFGELAIAEVGTGEWRALTDEGVFVGSPAWSPDGRNVYFASGRGGAINLWRQDARGGAPEQITVGPGDDADLDVNADGSRILFSTYRININLEEIVLNHASESARRWLTSDPGRGELAPVWSRDGKRIAYFTNRRAGENEAVWVMDADGGNPMAVAEDDRVNIGPRWLRDGQSLVYTSRAGGTGFLARSLELRRIQLTAGRPQRVPFAIGELFDPGLPAGLGDIGPQDQVLLRKADGSVQIFDLTTNRIATLKDVKGTDFQWRSDGRRFAAIVGPTHQTDPSSGVWVYDLEGKRHQVFHGWVASFRWAGVNELLVLEGKPDLNASLWRVRLDDSSKVRVDSMPLIYSFWHIVLTTRFDIHPDGKRLASEGVELHQADISLIEGIR
jgi:Tol biopolymer transport system component